VDGQSHARFGTDEVFIGGALRDENVSMSYSANFAQILVEFTATGLYELLGVRGVDVRDRAAPPRGGNRATRVPGKSRYPRHEQ